jgi:hypothetical protein
MTSYVTYNEQGVDMVVPVSTPVALEQQEAVKNLKEAMRDMGLTQTTYTDPNLRTPADEDSARGVQQ